MKRARKKKNVSESELHVYLELALEEEHGLEVQTSDLDYLRRRLYRARAIAKEQGDNRFDVLSITTSPARRGCLWLVKEKPDG